ncbi:hypothetical protein [Lysinibacillus sp. LZ02]|uniref:hypothetical protein n=1 Tax=Lysinibacillus sp. LZ02 TaxID=3420668 RepID=UPI003D36A394
MKKVAHIDELVRKKLSSSFRLTDHYTHIRGYHGCRPLNLETYYKSGIRNLMKEEALSETLIRLKSALISNEKIIEVFDKIFEESEGIWFTVSKDELLNNAGHYMIYGSEALQEIAAKLLLHDSLKHHGLPTIFSMDVPIKKITPFWLKVLEENILSQNCSGGYKTICAIAPDEIVEHYHPKKIIDWHNGGQEYLFKKVNIK